MRFFSAILRFLGGAPFAIFLISCTALFVAAGTLIESITGSHLHASIFTYDSRLFSLLLWGFFINILISALRRWPFKNRHIPFLITHWGLLMILAGMMIKGAYGTQGSMSLIEGSGSNEIAIAGSHALYVEERSTTRDSPQRHYYIFKSNFPPHSQVKKVIPTDASMDSGFSLDISLLNFAPNSLEKFDTWIKGGSCIVSGLPPIPVQSLPTDSSPLPFGVERLFSNGRRYRVQALSCSSEIAKTAEKAYISDCKIIIGDKPSQGIIYEGPLSEFLVSPLNTPYGKAKGTLHFNWSPSTGFKDPCLFITLERGLGVESVMMPLNGEQALSNLSDRKLAGKAPLTFDLIRPPQLLFLKDLQENPYLFTFAADGRLFSESFCQDDLKSVIVYDEGFGGYAIQTELPNLDKTISKSQTEKAQQRVLASELRKGIQNQALLAPPLQLLHQSCTICKKKFVEIAIAYLLTWEHGGGWLADNQIANKDVLEVLEKLNWASLPPDVYRGCLWNAYVFDKIDPLLKDGCHPDQAMVQFNWPAVLLDSDDPTISTFEKMTLQIFAASSHLPLPPYTITPPSPARLLSAYFRAYRIHPEQLFSYASASDIAILTNTKNQTNEERITIECPLTARQIGTTTLKKLEDNLPAIWLKVKAGGKQQLVSLGYDRFRNRLKWPILDGRYLVRFQPLCQSLPYHLRLRQARQINYVGTQQPYSYECDLIIKELSSGDEIEKTISMNEVHETWEGYRFYLSNISPSDPGEIKRVQIVVNYDPAKYFLTYPGAIILTLGIILLFWQRKRNTG